MSGYGTAGPAGGGGAPGPAGGEHPAGRPVEITVDGRAVAAREGATVAATLLAQGRRAWRTTPSGEPRGLFCGIGACFDCTAEVDGAPGVRTCLTPVAPGMRVSTDGGGR